MLLLLKRPFTLINGVQYLNTNHTLYSAVIKAEKDILLCGTEAQRTAHSLRVDFEKGGIHLSAGIHVSSCRFLL